MHIEQIFPQITQFQRDNRLYLYLDLETQHEPNLSATLFNYEISRTDENGEKIQPDTLTGNMLFTYVEHELYGERPCLAHILCPYFHSIYVIDGFLHMEQWIDKHGLSKSYFGPDYTDQPGKTETLEADYDEFRRKQGQFKIFLGPGLYPKASELSFAFFEPMRQEFISGGTPMDHPWD